MRKLKSVMILTVVLMLLFAQSVSAAPYFADTKATAHTMVPYYAHIGPLNSYADRDWFTYTNTTLGSQIVDIELYNPPGLNLDMDVEYCPTSSSCFSVPVMDNGAGATDKALRLNLAPGYTVYWVVRGHTDFDYSNDNYATYLLSF